MNRAALRLIILTVFGIAAAVTAILVVSPPVAEHVQTRAANDDDDVDSISASEGSGLTPDNGRLTVEPQPTTPSDPDAGVEPGDEQPSDSGSSDSGSSDSGSSDSGSSEDAPADTSSSDTGSSDNAPLDSGSSDSGSSKNERSGNEASNDALSTDASTGDDRTSDRAGSITLPSTTAGSQTRPVQTGRPPATPSTSPTTAIPVVESTTGSWSRLSVMTVVDPRDFGAVGDGRSDDTAALQRAVNALDGSGGIVYIGDGRVYKTTDVIRITGDHVKLWARSGRGQIYARTGGAKRRQAIVCEDVQGCGIHGVHFRSDAQKRLYALEDSQVALDGVTDGEVVGVEIEGSASAAVFVYGRSRRTFIEGNFIHDTWSDNIHFTNGSRQAWVWDNTLYNNGGTKGDDGVACVTYQDDALCGDMEWWNNEHLGSGWGRAYSVVGGEQIDIHDNFARDVAGAGVLVASEPSYDTPGSRNITIRNNILYRTGQSIPHPGILISGFSGRISNVTVRDNLVVDNKKDQPFREEGDTASVTMSNTASSSGLLPAKLPDISDGPKPSNTDVLKIRDTSFVPSGQRRGLYRVHVRRSTTGSGFEQRFEYLLSGSVSAVDRMLAGLGGTEILHRATVGSDSVIAVLSPRPLTAPVEVRGLSIWDLRAGDRNGTMSGLWAAVHR